MEPSEDQPLSDADKASIASEFILHAPPGEFKEVLSDIRELLGNDDATKELEEKLKLVVKKKAYK